MNEDKYIVADIGAMRNIKIENVEIVVKIRDALQELQNEVKKEIDELEKYYYDELR